MFSCSSSSPYYYLLAFENKMVTSYSVTQHLNRFSNFPTVGLWNSSIREAVNQCHPHKALLIFRQMKQNGCEPDGHTFPFVAKACSKLACLGCSQMVHAHVAKSPFRSDVFALTAVVDAYLKCNALGDAEKVFERMPVRDTAAWNSMIVGFSQSGFLDGVLRLFRRMRLEGIRPDSITIVGLTQASSHSKVVELLKAVHSFGIRSGLEGDVSVANTWIGAYARCGDLSSTNSVFDGIDFGARTVVSWNSLIEVYSTFGSFLDAIECYKRMLRERYRPDSITIVSLLSSCVKPQVLLQGASVHCHGIQLGCDSDVSVVNTLISMYSKCGDMISARVLFDGMPCRTCVSWNVVISGYAEKRDLDEALRLFHTMESAGEKPDIVTLLSLISGCGQTGALELGKWIDNYALSNGLRDNTIICNALIDMYAKCGSIYDAHQLFQVMPERTFVSWTAMISGCALNGAVKEALDLFEMMLESGVKPNHVTFLAVLQACVHSGLLEKGVEFFDMMTNLYNITPGLDHYSCIVDLFGRKGRIIEALEIVQSMPLKPDAGIWSSLLSACKIHRNVEIAKHASCRLFELDPTLSVPYVEMANIYASDGKWDGVAAVRKMMKCNNVKKSPGQSIVLVDGKPNVFAVDDRDHFESSCIYEILDSLMLQLKQDKYLAQTQSTVEYYELA